MSAFIDGLGYGTAWLSSLLTALIVTRGNGWAGTWLYLAALYAAGAICTELYLGRMLRDEVAVAPAAAPGEDEATFCVVG